MTLEAALFTAVMVALAVFVGWVLKGIDCAGDDAHAFRLGFREGVEFKGGRIADVVDLRARDR